MIHAHVPRRTATAGIIAGLMVAAALPVHAVNIPEGGAVTPDSTFLIHLRVTSGCEDLATDSLQVTIPEGVISPIPEAVPGWDVEIAVPEDDEEDSAEAETDESDGDDSLTQIRWSGGSVEDGNLLDFGLRARFPDEEGEVLEFPVIQGCGDVTVEHAPTVKLAKRYGQADIAELSDSVDRIDAEVQELRGDVDQLQEQVGDVNVVNLRSRVGDTEKAIKDLDERVSTLEGEPTPEPAE